MSDEQGQGTVTVDITSDRDVEVHVGK
jgi:hypothetical protein